MQYQYILIVAVTALTFAGLALFFGRTYIGKALTACASNPYAARLAGINVTRMGLIAFALGLIAWLNGAATVDWGPLGSAIGAGKVGPILLAVALAIFAIGMVAGVWFSWRRETHAYRRRSSA